MTINATYIATVLNSMIRMTSPILLAALTAAICNKVKVFNIGMEGTMMAGAFFSIVANYYTHSIFLAVLAGAASGLVISAINAICIIRFKASATVVGMAMNTLMTGATTYLLYVIFGVRGVFTDSSLLPLPRINLPIIKDIPFIGKVLANLTPIDYFAILLAVGMHIFLYKTVMEEFTKFGVTKPEVKLAVDKALEEKIGRKLNRNLPYLFRMAVVLFPDVFQIFSCYQYQIIITYHFGRVSYNPPYSGSLFGEVQFKLGVVVYRISEFRFITFRNVKAILI